MDDTEQGDTISIGTGPRFGYGDTIHFPIKRDGKDFWENTSRITDDSVEFTVITHTWGGPEIIDALRAIGADSTADTFEMLANAHNGLVTE